MDEIQNEIRHVALRLPAGGGPGPDYDDVYPPSMQEPRADRIMSRPPIPPARHELYSARNLERRDRRTAAGNGRRSRSAGRRNRHGVARPTRPAVTGGAGGSAAAVARTPAGRAGIEPGSPGAGRSARRAQSGLAAIEQA